MSGQVCRLAAGIAGPQQTFLCLLAPSGHRPPRHRRSTSRSQKRDARHNRRRRHRSGHHRSHRRHHRSHRHRSHHHRLRSRHHHHSRHRRRHRGGQAGHAPPSSHSCRPGWLRHRRRRGRHRRSQTQSRAAGDRTGQGACGWLGHLGQTGRCTFEGRAQLAQPNMQNYRACVQAAACSEQSTWACTELGTHRVTRNPHRRDAAKLGELQKRQRRAEMA